MKLFMVKRVDAEAVIEYDAPDDWPTANVGLNAACLEPACAGRISYINRSSMETRCSDGCSVRIPDRWYQAKGDDLVLMENNIPVDRLSGTRTLREIEAAFGG